MRLFMIDLDHLIINKVQLAKNFHIQPSELDKMMMWEYELFMKHLNSILKEENEKQEKEKEKYHLSKYQRMADPDNLQKMTQPKMPTMPSFGSMRMPSM